MPSRISLQLVALILADLQRGLSAGIIASLMKSEIFRDVFESINFPERVLYVRA